MSEKDMTIPLDEYIELMARVENNQFKLWFRGGGQVVAEDSGLAEAGKIGFRIDPQGTAEIKRFEIEKS